MNEQQYIRDASTNYYPALVEPAHSSRREQVHWRVRHLNLCALDHQTRRDASADPAIVWDPEERQYRFRRVGDVLCAGGSGQYLTPGEAFNALPPPPPANGGGAEDAEGEGASDPLPPAESSHLAETPTGGGLEYERKAHFHKPHGGSDDR